MTAPVAIITGGEGDLARVLAEQLAEAGYRVHAPGRSELDVRCAESVSRYMRAAGRIDLLVNNAGITGDGVFARQSPPDWDRVLDTNLKGAHLCSQLAIPIMMRQRSGQIIHIGSYAAIHPSVGQTAYAASKAGLIGLTKSYAREVGKRNIRINCVLPGFLETKMTEPLDETVKSAALARHALNRFNTAEEAARFIVFLAGTQHISGQVFQLDSRA